jgi:DnaK suppressor protein
MIASHEKLKRIRDALDRLNEAKYGICEECGEEISEKRLQVMPFAAYCLECQAALEDKELSPSISFFPENL